MTAIVAGNVPSGGMGSEIRTAWNPSRGAVMASDAFFAPYAGILHTPHSSAPPPRRMVVSGGFRALQHHSRPCRATHRTAHLRASWEAQPG